MGSSVTIIISIFEFPMLHWNRWDSLVLAHSFKTAKLCWLQELQVCQR